MTDDELQTIPAGDTDITVEVCTGGMIELGITDDVEAMYGSLDIAAAEALIEALERAIAQARRS